MNTRETRPPRIFTIPQDVPFLETLARAILDGDLPVAGGTPPDRLALTGWTILLPTRRAVRALRDAFLRVSGDCALMLPRIRPLGDVDEDELSLGAVPEAAENADLALSQPPAIGTLQRRLVLTKLVLAWSRSVAEAADAGENSDRATPAQAAGLAAQLASLMDGLDTEQVNLDALADLVPDRFADHWQKTLAFLQIVTENWPRYLEEKGFQAPYARRNALMEAETERLRSSPPDAPVIAAGSTATVPATADLLEAVSRLENGAVILPGLDMSLDDESWQAISKPDPHPEHPQFGMQQFLARIDMRREEVRVLTQETTPGLRGELISQAMRPAGTTEKWLEFSRQAGAEEYADAFQGLTRIDAPTEQHEAEVISLILRRAAEKPEGTAALVTPDRALARRVSARLERWGLRVDDSAGKPLAKTLPGSFIDLIAEASGKDFAPVPLLALLKHPLTRLGRPAAEIRHAARLLELVVFRQPIPGRGIEAHRRALARCRRRVRDGAHVHPNIKRLSEKDWQAVDNLLDDLETAAEPLSGLFARPGARIPLETHVRSHIEVGQNLAREETGSYSALWRGNAGEALAELFEGLLSDTGASVDLTPSEYPDFYRALVLGVPVRETAPTHPRIFIWGPLEARLQRPDTVVLGGLNEGTWPATVESDPWLSRPMRAEVGLSAPERRIGLSAHDVAQLLGVETVFLTRSQKVAGAPTVASRWLLRLDAVLRALGMEKALKPADPWLDWAGARDTPEPVPPIAAPAPSPPVEARPTQLSVTRIESWMANPYDIFAREILRLYPLDPLAGEPDAALRGTLIHDVLAEFAREFPDALPDDISDALVRIAEKLFGDLGDQARIEAFWRGQIGHFASWFAATEPARRADISSVHAETRGVLELDDPVDFTLTARADRIDESGDGALVIYDYKTGAPPTQSQVENCYAPQLPLEAAIAIAGGFEGVPAGPVSRLAYIRARGYGEGGEERDASKTMTPDALAGEAMEHLKRLVGDFSRPSQPYRALRRPGFSYRYDDYAHLARVREWQSGSGEQ